MRLLSIPRPKSSSELDAILTLEQLTVLLIRKRMEQGAALLGNEAKVMRSGFVVTSKGCVLNSVEALAAARKHADLQHYRRVKALNTKAHCKIRALQRKEKVSITRLAAGNEKWERFASLSGIPAAVMKARAQSMVLKIVLVRARTRECRQEAAATPQTTLTPTTAMFDD